MEEERREKGVRRTVRAQKGSWRRTAVSNVIDRCMDGGD